MAISFRGKAAASRAHADATQRASVARLTERRADLATQLDAVQTITKTRQRELEWALINASPEDAIASAENAAGDAARRERTLVSAITVIDRQIDEARAEVARERDQAKRLETARAHEASLVALKAAMPPLIEALTRFATAGAKLDPLVWDVKSLNSIAGTLALELPDAMHRVAVQAEWQISQILGGEASPTLGTNQSGGPSLPTPQTMAVYSTGGLKWRDPAKPVFIHHRPAFATVDLPAGLAETAIALGVALKPGDPLVATFKKTQIQKVMPLKDCKWIDGTVDEEPESEVFDDHLTPFKA
jgi:hypothetical protein